MALYAYRRQDLLREIGYLVGYNRRCVWLIRTPEVRLYAARRSGHSRITYRVLSLNPLRVLPIAPKEGRIVELTEEVAVAAQPIFQGERGIMLVFLHPTTYDEHQWSSRKTPRLKSEELMILRQHKFPDRNAESVARAICYHRGLVDKEGCITSRGNAVLLAHSAGEILTDSA